jgi:spore maturation protein SpmB
VGAFYLLRGLPVFRPRAGAPAEAEAPDPSIEAIEVPAAAPPREPMGPALRLGVAAVVLALAVALAVDALTLVRASSLGEALKVLVSRWPLPLLVAGCLLVGWAGRVRVYESMVEGAKEGLEVAARIVPYLVAILVAVAMFRASGALDEILIPLLDPLTSRIGVPAEVLPMALLRPLSGSGAFGVMSEIVTAHGPDSFIGLLTCTIQGSTETTFYVLALYLGAARVREGRHTLAACLTGDVAGFLGAVLACHWFFA